MTRNAATAEPIDGDDGPDAELARVLDAFLADVEAGRPADPDRLLADHPSLADRLRGYLPLLGLADHLDGPLEDDEPGPIMLAGAAARASTRSEVGPRSSVLLADPPGDGDEPVVTRPAGPAAAIGRYQILGEIARGGMGAVFKARDADLGRDLAVKVLLETHRDDPDARRRFVEEAQIGGQLQHPGIVPVFELGDDADRRPFLAMTLVRGRTLAAMLAERTSPADDLTRSLTIFEQVAQTVAYAHARRVIHRDLKPGNVMVGAFGEVQVMDWGLAKVLPKGGVADERRAAGARESLVHTVRSGEGSATPSEAGSVLGTPAYMAPEQARGEVDRLDERADVFGLGAILCEILTGRAPYEGRTPGELRTAAARADLAGTRDRLASCGADEGLRSLALSCLAADPIARPHDAGAVARRVASYRAEIQDRLRAAELAQATAQARAREERTRLKLIVALAASVLLLVGLGGLWALAYQRQADEDSRRVAVALGRASPLLDSARDAWANRRDASGYDRAVQAAEALLTGRLPADLRRRVGGLAAGARAEAAAVAVDRTLLAELAALRTSALDLGLGEADRAYIRAFRKARLDLVARDPGDAIARLAARPRPVGAALAAHLDAWAGLRLKMKGEPERAARLLRAARAADPDPYRLRLRALLESGNLEARRDELARLVNDARSATLPAPDAVLLAAVLAGVGDVESAIEVLGRAVIDHPDDLWVNYDLATYLERRRPPSHEEALRYFTAARALWPESGHELGHLLDRMGRVGEARAIFLDLIGRQPDILGDMPCYGDLDRVGLPAASAALDREWAAARAEVARAPDDPTAYFRLGNISRVRGDRPGAGAAYRAAIGLKPDFLQAHFNLGVVLQDSGDAAGAAAEYRESIRLDPELAAAHNNLGNILRDAGDPAGAIAACRESIRLAPEFAGTHNNLGNALRDAGDLAGAAAEYREAIRLAPELPEAHCNLGVALGEQGRHVESLAEYRRGHDLGSKRPGWTHPSAEWVRRAEQMAALADRLPAVLRAEDRPADAAEGLDLALIAYRVRRYAAASRLFAESLTSRPDLAEDRRARHRYNAACSAALAAAGRGEEEPPPDPAAKAALRRRALGWLEAERAAWARVLESEPTRARPAVARTLRRWRADPDLATVRDGAALSGLAATERAEWQALWSGVAGLLAKAEGKSTP
jgi:serine/threonine-protein kinase